MRSRPTGESPMPSTSLIASIASIGPMIPEKYAEHPSLGTKGQARRRGSGKKCL